MKKLNNLILTWLMLSTIAKAQSGNELEKKFQEIHQAWFEGLHAENHQAMNQLLDDEVTWVFH